MLHLLQEATQGLTEALGSYYERLSALRVRSPRPLVGSFSRLATHCQIKIVVRDEALGYMLKAFARVQSKRKKCESNSKGDKSLKLDILAKVNAVRPLNWSNRIK